MSTPPTSHRKYTRIAIGVAGSIHLGSEHRDPIPCEIVDISVGGAFVHCTAPVALGQEILIAIHFEMGAVISATVSSDPQNLDAELQAPEKSTVRWVRGSSKSGFGVEFAGLNDSKKRYIAKLIEHLERKS